MASLLPHRVARAATLVIAAALLLSLSSSAPANAASFGVTKTADTADGSCDLADCSLREAVIAANAAGGADTINVPAGHYTLTYLGGTQLSITGDLTIAGAGAESTSVDGNATVRVFDITGASTSVTMSGLTVERGKNAFGSAIQTVGSALSLSGVTMTGNTAGGGGVDGFGTIEFMPSVDATLNIADSTISGNQVGGGAGGGGFGGGVFMSSATRHTVTVTDSTIGNNTLAGGGGNAFGGGIYSAPGAAGGTLTITGSSFNGNSIGGGGGDGFGGGVFFSSPGPQTVTVENSSFNNSTGGGGGGDGFGGGIYDAPGGAGGTLTVRNSTFTGNALGGGGATGDAFGGGVFFSSGGPHTVTVENSTFSSNSLGGNGGDGFGGGVFNSPGAAGGTMTIARSTFAGNAAGGGGGDGFGGGVFLSSAGPLTTTVSDSTISTNSLGGGAGGDGFGGGIYDSPGGAGGTLSLTNSTISTNAAGVGVGSNGFGGGVFFSAGGPLTAPFTNTTIVDNTASGAGFGGALFISTIGGSGATPKNVIIAGNSAATDSNCSGTITSQGHNLESADTCTFNAAGDLKNTDPKLDPLADNGGPTKTRALQKGSPAIDAGDNSGCPATDQRGGSRPQPPGGACDIGAFEFGALADLALAKTASPDTVSAGKDLTYTLTVTNNGPDEAAGIRVDDTVPADPVSVSASPSQGSCSGSGPVTCSIGTLAKGASATATITVKLTKAGTATNTAAVSGNPTETNSANNTATASATVRPTIRSLKVKPRKFRAARKGGSVAARRGARVRYSLYEAASVRFTVERASRGRKVGKSCKKPTRKNRKRKRCTRYKKVKGSFKRTGKAAKTNRFKFTGRLARKRLRPGNYRLVGVATASGIDSEQKTARFSIVG